MSIYSSSHGPNLQNIPIRTELGTQIKEAFRPKFDLNVDYKSLENKTMQFNIRTILCDSCSDPALEYDSDMTSVHTLEGHICHCQSCSALGRISVDDENGRMQFILLNKEEMSHVEFPVLVEAYEVSQKKIDELYEENSRLRQQLRDLKK